MSTPSEPINRFNATLQCPAGSMIGINKCYTCPTGYSGKKSGNTITCSGTPNGQFAAIPAVAAAAATTITPEIKASDAIPAVPGTCSVGELTPSSSGGLPVCVVSTQFE